MRRKDQAPVPVFQRYLFIFMIALSACQIESGQKDGDEMPLIVSGCLNYSLKVDRSEPGGESEAVCTVSVGDKLPEGYETSDVSVLHSGNGPLWLSFGDVSEESNDSFVVGINFQALDLQVGDVIWLEVQAEDGRTMQLPVVVVVVVVSEIGGKDSSFQRVAHDASVDSWLWDVLFEQE